MRAWARWPLRWLAGVLVLGLGMASCTGSQDRVDAPPTPRPTGQTISPEPSASPEDDDVASGVVSVEFDQGAGSGVVVTADGHVLTSNHLVTDAADGSVAVVFNGGQSSPATVVGGDARSNLAVVKVDDVPDLEPAILGDSDAIEIGDEVQILNRLGGSVSGTVRARSRTVDGISMIEVAIPASPEGAGGVLVNTAGEVIGFLMVTGSAVGDGDSSQVGYAIHSNIAARVADQLIDGEEVTHPYLGVSLGDAPAGGALVENVAAGGPAERAGLRTGDVITRLGERAVGGPHELVYAVQSGNVGDELTVAYTRDGAERDAVVTLGQAPPG